MTVRPVSFESHGCRLQGVLHSPRTEPSERIGVIFFNAGVQPKTGPFRTYVRLARRLAELGFWSFRFDFPGTGDSEGLVSSKQMDRFSLADAGAAIQTFRREAGLDKVTVLGLCSGARLALKAAAKDECITSLVLLSTPFIPVITDDSERLSLDQAFNTRRRLMHYLGRIRQGESWKRLFSLRSNYRLLWQTLTQGLRSPKSLLTVDAELMACVFHLLERGRRMLFLYGSNDLYYPSFQMGLKDRLNRWNGGNESQYTLRLLEGASHTFQEVSNQERLIEEVTAWLTRAGAPLERTEAVL